MKVSLNWLKEFVDIDIDPEELGERLTMAGLEVDKIDYIGKGLEEVRVARIKSIRQHPNADKLVVCEVDKGTETVQIVCGAKNMKENDKVALASPGTTLPNGLELKKAKIRGEVSFGMMCSLTEMCLGEDHSGILILPEDAEIGRPVTEVLGLDDIVYDLEITPNRPDCLSILGVAREVGAILNKKVRVPEINAGGSSKSAAEWTSVTIEDYDLCPRYAARIIDGVKLGTSPEWMRRKLEACGVRAINNIVDITNYVLLELGHPLHAFDYHKLSENRIVVRPAVNGEVITTLDEEERKLTPDMLVIADSFKPVAIAGVMGGANSEVGERTTTVLLESACFKPSSVRRTARQLGLSTEASYRFERGADPDIQIIAADRAAELMAQLAGGTIASGAIDANKGPVEKKSVTLRVKRLNDLLGTTLSQGEAEEIFRRLQIETTAPDSEKIEAQIPTFRVDIEREIDLIEEIGRIYGYENIPTPQSRASVAATPPNTVFEFENETKRALTGLGLYEIINCNLINRKSLERIGDRFFDSEKLLSVLDSDSSEQNLLRPTLLVDALNTVARNLNQHQTDIKLFELGRVHVAAEKKGELPNEMLLLGLALCGLRSAGSWGSKQGEIDFFDLKGVIEKYFESINVTEAEFKPDADPFFRAGMGASIMLDETKIGIAGEVSRDVREKFDIKTRVFVAEIDTRPLLAYQKQYAGFEQLSMFPSTSRDIAMVVDQSVSYEQIMSVMDQMRRGLVSSIELFDCYRGDQIGTGKKSLAFSITYKSTDRTLTDEEVEKNHAKIIKRLVRELNCEIRQ
jgi:phenylalanyl-tRNA synthetase beta chain